MQTVGSLLDRNKGLGPGFDFLRIFLALAIVAWHSRNVVYWTSDTLTTETPFWFGEYCLVPIFFALSGFLVAGSGMRLTLANFLVNRGLRILPALALEILFSAFLLGPLFTELPLAEYFRSPLLYHYLTNMVGWVNFYLPGVFVHHPWTMVNGALWTIPYEMICYVVISILIVTRWLHSGRAVAICTLGLMVIAVILRNTPGMEGTFDGGGGSAFDRIVRFFFTGEQSRLLDSFLMGILFYQFRNRIPYSLALLGLSVCVCVAVAIAGDLSWMSHALLRFATVPAMTYIMAFAGVTAIPLPWPYTRGDYSYGIYLYHLPFQQMLWSFFPGIGALQMFLLSVPTCSFVAAFSWHVVEKPVLRLRKRFSFVARARGVLEVPPMPTPSADTSSLPIASSREAAEKASS